MYLKSKITLFLFFFFVANTPVTSGSSPTILLGEQPFYLPANLIISVVKRDLVFAKALSKSNIKLQWVPYQSGEEVNQAFYKSRIVGGGVGDMPLLRAASQSKIFVPIMLQQGFTSLVMNKPMFLKGIKNKKIGVVFGSNAHYTALLAVDSAGLSQSQVQLVPLKLSEIKSHYLEDKISGFSAWEPILSHIQVQQKSTFSVYRHLSTGYFYLSQEFVDLNPAFTEELILSMVRAIRWVDGDYKNLLQASRWAIADAQKVEGAPQFYLKAKQVAKLSDQDLFTDPNDGRLSQFLIEEPSHLQKEFSLLLKHKLLEEGSTWEETKKSFKVDYIPQLPTLKKRPNADSYSIRGEAK